MSEKYHVVRAFPISDHWRGSFAKTRSQMSYIAFAWVQSSLSKCRIWWGGRGVAAGSTKAPNSGEGHKERKKQGEGAHAGTRANSSGARIRNDLPWPWEKPWVSFFSSEKEYLFNLCISQWSTTMHLTIQSWADLFCLGLISTAAEKRLTQDHRHHIQYNAGAHWAVWYFV